MAYPVDRIVPINLIIQQAGLQYANFVTIRAIADSSMLNTGATFDVDTWKTYDSLLGVAEDFTTSSPVYYMAENWFGQTPSPGAGSFQAWMWDDVNDNLIPTLNKAEDIAPWCFFIGIEGSVYNQTQQTALDIATWAGNNRHIVPLAYRDADNLDENIDTDTASIMVDGGYRFITQKYRSPSIVQTDARQAYSHIGEMAYFQRFDFDGVSTSVDPEFDALQGVIGENLTRSEYTALESKKLGFYTEMEMKGERISSRVKNSWTTSNFNETVDDVFSLEVLANRMQVDAFNYLSRRKRGLRTPRDYGGLISTVEAVARQANVNGTLASDVPITDPRTGEEVVLTNGFLTISQPEDVQNLTQAQIEDREYPAIQMIVVLARGARVAAINLVVE